MLTRLEHLPDYVGARGIGVRKGAMQVVPEDTHVADESAGCVENEDEDEDEEDELSNDALNALIETFEGLGTS